VFIGNTKGNKVQFHISSNEFTKSNKLENYHFYIVESVNSDKPLITIIKAPLPESTFFIEPESYFVTTEKVHN